VPLTEVTAVFTITLVDAAGRRVASGWLGDGSGAGCR